MKNKPEKPSPQTELWKRTLIFPTKSLDYTIDLNKLKIQRPKPSQSNMLFYHSLWYRRTK